MTNITAKGFLQDALIILEEAEESLAKNHFHRVVRKCQEASELTIKSLFRFYGIEYPKSHILGRAVKKEIGRLNTLNHEELEKLAYLSDSLAFDREPAFYGTLEGEPASAIFDVADAEQAIQNTKWIITVVQKVVSGFL